MASSGPDRPNCVVVKSPGWWVRPSESDAMMDVLGSPFHRVPDEADADSSAWSISGSASGLSWSSPLAMWGDLAAWAWEAQQIPMARLQHALPNNGEPLRDQVVSIGQSAFALLEEWEWERALNWLARWLTNIGVERLQAGDDLVVLMTRGGMRAARPRAQHRAPATFQSPPPPPRAEAPKPKAKPRPSPRTPRPTQKMRAAVTKVVRQGVRVPQSPWISALAPAYRCDKLRKSEPFPLDFFEAQLALELPTAAAWGRVVLQEALRLGSVRIGAIRYLCGDEGVDSPEDLPDAAVEGLAFDPKGVQSWRVHPLRTLGLQHSVVRLVEPNLFIPLPHPHVRGMFARTRSHTDWRELCSQEIPE